MNPSRIQRQLTAAALAGGAALMLAAPASANIGIPDGATVPRDRVSAIHFRVIDGCDGQATDAIEITIPESVENVFPEAVPGWTLEVETREDADGEEGEQTDQPVRTVRWSGGPLPAGQFADFGLRAYFPDIDGPIQFPTIQRCGLTEIRWDGDAGSENEAPRVGVGRAIGDQAEVELAQSVESLRADVASLQEELSGVDPSTVRNRVGRLEDRLPNLVDRIEELTERVQALEQAMSDATDGSATGEGDSQGG